MDLEEFKFIFYMEWAHRMIGRFIGLAFILPATYFAARGYMSKAIQKRSLIVATMIGCQGLLGMLFFIFLICRRLVHGEEWTGSLPTGRSKRGA